MREQLSLFGEENAAYGKAIQRFLELDFRGSLEELERYRRLFPAGHDVEPAIKEASFLNTRLKGFNWSEIDLPEGERGYRIWIEFEDEFGWPWREGSHEEKLQARYFSRLADGLAAGGHSETTLLSKGVPMGLVHLLAGRPKEAILSLQGLIAGAPENAKTYGYLGDTYFILGDVRMARICYREAFSIEPKEVDLRRLRDRTVRERLEELREDQDIEGDPLEWFPARGQLEGLFEPRVFRDLETLKHWAGRYVDLIRSYRENGDRRLVPRLFYLGMALSDNARMLQHVKEVDLVEVRRRMKEWHPALFARHMRLLEVAER